MHRARRAHALAALALTVSAAAALSAGCAATNPVTTQLVYDPADGQVVDLGGVRVGNLLVIVKSGTEGPGALVGRITNGSGSAKTVTISGSGDAQLDAATFDVPASGATSIGPHSKHSATLPTVGARPGQLIHLQVAVEGGKTRTVSVPVLSGAQPEYAKLVPTPTPTEVPLPTPTISLPPSMTSSAPPAPPSPSSRPTSRSTTTSVRAPSPTSAAPVTQAAPAPAPSPPSPSSPLTLAGDSASPTTSATS